MKIKTQTTKQMFNLSQRSEENTNTNTQSVRSTVEYDQFTHIQGNRPIEEPNVKAIANQLQQHAQIVPIVVNSKYQVIDGQHRLEACRRLKIPVKFIVEKGANMDAVITANAVGKKWSEMDHINRHAVEGKREYIQLQKWVKECKTLGFNYGPSIMMAQLSGTRRSCYMYDDGKVRAADRHSSAKRLYGVGTVIKVGMFQFPSIEQSKAFRSALIKFNEFPFYQKSAFVSAINQCLKIDEFDVDRLLEAAQKYPRRFTNEVTSADFIQMIEKAYNYRKHSKLSIVMNAQRFEKA